MSIATLLAHSKSAKIAKLQGVIYEEAVMKRLASILTIGIAAALLGAGDSGKSFTHKKEETKVFEMTNQERKAKDVRALKLNPALSKIARAHSENMVKQGKFDHKLDDKGLIDRLRDAGYKFMKAAENIAIGEKGASQEAVMKSWMESELHRTNLLNPDYTEIGVGVATDKDGQVYYTQVFGKPLK